MSHGKERHEKTCLNCNAELNGRYCHVCGQENVEPKETVWGLVSHFFYDITHFDGKFFSTTKYLVTKPGFLPKEYIAGRRARYLHPIRMYVFSSALFFLIFFSLFKPNSFLKGDWADPAKLKDSLVQLDVARRAVLSTVNTKEDSLSVIKSFDDAKASIQAEQKRKDSLEGDDDDEDQVRVTVIDTVIGGKKMRYKRNDPDLSWGNWSEKFTTVAAYDSAQAALPPGKRDGWWQRRVVHRNIELKAHYGDDKKKLLEDLVDKFLHTFPYLLFLSLPLYALFMKLLYWRHKQFYYVDHGIFFIYLYIFTFIYLLVFYSVVKLREYTHWGWIGWVEFVLTLGGIYYTYKAMRNFYKQGRSMTILKFVLLNFMASFVILILFIIFLTLTIYRL